MNYHRFFALPVVSALLVLTHPVHAAPTAYQTAVIGNGPYLYYELGETSGTTASDSSGHAFNGTYTGGFTLGQAGDNAGGTSDKAVLFNGTSGYVLTPAAVTNFGSYIGNSSCEFVYKVANGYATQGDLLGCAVTAANNINFIVGLNSDAGGTTLQNAIRLYIRDNAGNAYGAQISDAAAFDGNYHHLVCTFAAPATINIYVDGVLQTIANTTGGTVSAANFNAFNQQLTIAADNNHGLPAVVFAAATIDEAAIYTNVLTAAQVTAHYAALTGIKLLVTSVVPGTTTPTRNQNVTVTANVTYFGTTPSATATLNASGLNSSASAVAMAQQSYNSGTGVAVYTNTVTVSASAALGATNLTVVASDTLGDKATNSVAVTVTPAVVVNSVVPSPISPSRNQNVTVTANVTYSGATPSATATLNASGLNPSASAVAMMQQSYNSGTGQAVYTNTVTVDPSAALGATTLTVVASDTMGDLATNSVAVTVTLPSTNVIQSALLKLVVQPSPFSFQVIELSSGTVLLQQTTNQFTIGSTRGAAYATNFVITPTTLDADLILSGTSATGHIAFNFIQPGILQTTLSSSNNMPSQIFQQFADQGEDIFGGFECPTGGTLSTRNFSHTFTQALGVANIVNFDSAKAPFYLTTRHYGVYAQTDALGTLTFAQSGFTSFSFNVPQLTFDIIYGTDYATIMAGYNTLAGGSYMPPRWAFDSTWWKDDDHSSKPSGVTSAQGNVLDTANKLALYQIHASSEWIDRPYGTTCSQGAGGWGNMDFDTSSGSFPNPTQMVSDLHARGLNLMLWIADYCWCDIYDEGLADGYLFNTGDTNKTTADFSNTNAFHWFQTNLNALVNFGVMGYKIDRGDENETPNSVNNHNDTLFQQLAKGGLDAAYPNNAFVFSRCATDTARQYTALWNGDTASTFPGLQYSVIAGLRAGIINFPMWGSDTGGYQINNAIPPEELFDRWLEFSAYSTIMEVLHGAGRTPWYNYSTNFSSPTNIVAIAAAQAGAHHDLIPYSQSCLYQATQTGMPVMRPIMFGYPNDNNNAVTITNCEYLFGPNILVAPVITAGATTRNVYLPADCWLDYNTKSNLYTGPANITAAAPIQTIPLFVNQGAIIPRGDILQGNNSWTPNWAPNLRIEFFPSENSGSSFPYYTGSSVQSIACVNQNHTLNIQFGDLGYAGNLQVYLQSLGSVAGTVVSNGVSLASGTGYTYNSTTHLLQVPFNGPTTLVVSNAGSLFSPLEAWRVANFGNPSDPAVSGDSANPSGDGIANILKYAFGLNPLAVSTNGLPFESIVTSLGTNYLALTFPRATNATDCTFTVLVTSNLVGQLSQWQTGSSYSGPNIISNTANTTEVSRVLTNNVEMITVRDNVPMTSAPHRFMTVRVTIP